MVFYESANPCPNIKGGVAESFQYYAIDGYLH